MAQSTFTQNLQIKYEAIGLDRVVNATRVAAGQIEQINKSIAKAAAPSQALPADSGRTFTEAILGVGGAAFILRNLKLVGDAYGELVNQVATAKQVFDDSGFEIIAEQAKEAVDAFGLSETGFIRATTLLAGLGKASGLAGKDLANFSVGLTKIATDLSAAFNTSVEDATSAIQSGFSGSSIEPLRRYNIVINDTALKQEYFALTGEKVSGVLSFQQRQLAFVSLLTKQSADYTGQWERESGGLLATQQKLTAELANFRTEVGSGVAPAMRDVTAGATALLSLFTALPDAVTRTTGAFAAGIGVWAAARGGLAAIDYGAQRAGGRIGDLASRAMPKLVTATNVAGIALAGYAVAAAETAAQQDKLNRAVEKFVQTNSLNEMRVELEKIAKTDSRSWWETFTREGEDNRLQKILGVFQDTTPAVDEYRNSLTDLIDELDDPVFTQSIYAFAKDPEGLAYLQSLFREVPTLDVLKQKLDQQAAARANLASKQVDLNALLAETQREMATTPELIEMADKSYDEFGKTIGDVADQVEKAADKFEDLYDAVFDSANATRDSRITFLELLTAAEKLDELRKGGVETAQQQLDILKQEDDIQEDLSDLVAQRLADIERLNGKALDPTQKLTATRDILKGLASELPEQLQPFLAELQAQFDKAQPTLKVQAELADPDAFAKRVSKAIQEIDANEQAEIILDVFANFSGLNPDEIQKVLDQVPPEKRRLILDTAIDTAAAQGKLDDEEFIAQTIIELSFREAFRAIQNFQNDPRVQGTKMRIDGDLTALWNKVNGFRDEAAKGTKWNVDLNWRYGGVRPDLDYGGAVSGLSAVQAQQPVNANFIFPASVSPSEVMTATRDWLRRNGTP